MFRSALRLRFLSSSPLLQNDRVQKISNILSLPESEKPMLKLTNLVHKWNAEYNYNMVWHALHVMLNSKKVPNHEMLNNAILGFTQDFSNGGERVVELFKVMLQNEYYPSGRVVSNIISVMNRRKYAKIEDVIEIVTYIESGLGGIEWNEILASRILDLFIIHGLHDMFDVHFAKFRKDGVISEGKSRLLLMKQLTMRGNIEEAMELLKKIEKSGDLSQSTAIDYLLSALYREKKVKEAMKLYKSAIASSLCSIATFNSIMSTIAFSPEGKIDDVWDVYDDLKKYKIQPDLVFFCSLLNACAKKGSVEDSYKIITEMLHHRIQMDSRSFNLFLSNFVQSGDLASSRKMLEHMRELGITPNATTYSKVLFALANSSEPSTQKALEMLHEMETCKIKPSELTFIALFSVYAKSAKQDPLYLSQIFEHFEKNNVSLSTTSVNSLVGIFTKQGVFKDLNSFWEFFEKLGLKANVVSFNSYIKALATNGEVYQALEIINFMKSRNIMPNPVTFYHLIQGICNANASWDVVIAYFEELLKHGFVPKPTIFNFLVNHLVKSNDSNKEEKLDAVLKLILSDSRNFDEKLAITYANACFHLLHEKGVLQILREMEREQLFSGSSIRMLRGFFKSHKLKGSKISFLESFRYLNQIPAVEKFYEEIRRKEDRHMR
jgi:pentatricopeptide repeat protein